MFKQLKKGFTLVELIVVIVILGIISGITISKMSDKSDKAKIEVFKNHLQSYDLFISMITTENSYYQLMNEITLSGFDDGDEDVLDELVAMGKIENNFPTSDLKDKDNFILEFRTITISKDPIIYMYIASTDEADNKLIDAAIESYGYTSTRIIKGENP